MSSIQLLGRAPAIFWPTPFIALLQGAILPLVLVPSTVPFRPLLAAATAVVGVLFALVIIYIGPYLVFKKNYTKNGSPFGRLFVQAFFEEPKIRRTKLLFYTHSIGTLIAISSIVVCAYRYAGPSIELWIIAGIVALFALYSTARTYYARS